MEAAWKKEDERWDVMQGRMDLLLAKLETVTSQPLRVWRSLLLIAT
jgi:hypothetical protein